MMSLANKYMHSRLGRKQRGLAAVEAVIALPIVLLTLFAVAEFGHAILQYNALTQAVSQGARYLAGVPMGTGGAVDISSQDITNTTQLVAYGVVGTGTAILPGFTPGDVVVEILGDGNISVTANYEYQPVITGGSPNVLTGERFLGALTMSAGAVMPMLSL